MDQLFRKYQNYVVDMLIIFFTIVVFPGLLISLSRIPAIGIRPEMFVHIFLTGLVLLLALYRRKIPFKLKAVIAVTGFMFIGYSGFFSIGLSSSGRLDIVISIALATMLFGFKTGLVLAIVNTFLVSIVAYLQVGGYLLHNIDFNIYNYAARSWFAAIYNFVAMGVVVVLLSGFIDHLLRQNLRKLAEKQKQLRREVTQRKLAEEQYKELSETDPLTKLYNRRYFFNKADVEFARSKRYGSPLSLIIADADYFKNINDNFGHQTGDKVLIKTANILNAKLRPSDIACRFGGEEFCILLPETNIIEAQNVAERFRSEISSARFDNKEVHLTCSFGIAQFKETDEELSHMVSRADEALYKAKKSGRNTIISAR
ncbi:GGDEF domain-containing protein [Deferribacteres bacterium DY0037]